MKFSISLIVAGVTFFLASCSSQLPTQEVFAGSNQALPELQVAKEGLFLDGFFPIGVFSQPEQSFAKWKARGVNTILETPQGHDPESWDRAAKAAGLKIIRRPLGDPKRDIGRTDLLAWSHWDEPDAAGRAPQWTPLFEKQAAEWRKIDPKRRIFINFAGPDLSWFTTRSDSYSVSYASHYPRLIATADWIANDLYPSGGWLNQAHSPRRGDVSLIAEPLKILKGMTDKPLFAFIEASEVEKGNVPGARCPTPAEMRAQIWLTLVHGARGIFYFPAVVGTSGFQFDGAPPDIVVEMQRQNGHLSKLGPLLQSEINPAALQVKTESNINIGWRMSGKALLIMAVNPHRREIKGLQVNTGASAAAASGQEVLTGQTVRITSGQVVLDFEPLGVKVLLIQLP